jgi:hypothetical protein
MRHRCTSGRLRATIDKEDKILTELSNYNPPKNAGELNTEMWKNYKLSTNVGPTKGQLRHAGLFERRSAKKPDISLLWIIAIEQPNNGRPCFGVMNLSSTW